MATSAKENPNIFYTYVDSRKAIKMAIRPLKNAQGNAIGSDEGMTELLNEYFESVYTEEDLLEMSSVSAL